jgi:hypothetical protein
LSSMFYLCLRKAIDGVARQTAIANHFPYD